MNNSESAFFTQLRRFLKKVNEMELDPFQKVHVLLTIFSEFYIQLISIPQMHFLLFIFTFLRVS